MRILFCFIYYGVSCDCNGRGKLLEFCNLSRFVYYNCSRKVLGFRRNDRISKFSSGKFISEGKKIKFMRNIKILGTQSQVLKGYWYNNM